MVNWRRIGLTTLGGILVAAGIAALVLPGPGLLLLALGLLVLAQEYEWAQRRLEPVKQAAMHAAAEGVRNWHRIALSALGVCVLLALGALWIVSPAPPGWWPLAEHWWLIGGWGAGATLILSGLVAAALLAYSLRTFRSAARAETPQDRRG